MYGVLDRLGVFLTWPLAVRLAPLAVAGETVLMGLANASPLSPLHWGGCNVLSGVLLRWSCERFEGWDAWSSEDEGEVTSVYEVICDRLVSLSCNLGATLLAALCTLTMDSCEAGADRLGGGYRGW